MLYLVLLTAACGMTCANVYQSNISVPYLQDSYSDSDIKLIETGPHLKWNSDQLHDRNSEQQMNFSVMQVSLQDKIKFMYITKVLFPKCVARIALYIQTTEYGRWHQNAEWAVQTLRPNISTITFSSQRQRFNVLVILALLPGPCNCIEK